MDRMRVPDVSGAVARTVRQRRAARTAPRKRRRHWRDNMHWVFLGDMTRGARVQSQRAIELVRCPTRSRAAVFRVRHPWRRMRVA